jgi:hypothetical protein
MMANIRQIKDLIGNEPVETEHSRCHAPLSTGRNRDWITTPFRVNVLSIRIRSLLNHGFLVIQP